MASVLPTVSYGSPFSRISDPKIADAFIDELVAKAREQGNASPLLRHHLTVFFYLIGVPKDRKKARTERILEQLHDQALSPEQARLASGMRSKLRSLLEQDGLLTKPEFSVAAGEGPWRDYVTKPIRISRPTDDVNQLVQVAIDHRADAERRGGEIVLVWTKKNQQMCIERIGLEGTPKKIGADFTGFPKAFAGVQLAFSDDATFVASETSGFSVLSGDEVEVYGEKQGVPAAEVDRLAWCDGRLYVAYRDAFASFDPVKKSFELIASSISVEPRNALDGRGSFFINAMLADEKHSCLWFNVQDNALPRVPTACGDSIRRRISLNNLERSKLACRGAIRDAGASQHSAGRRAARPALGLDRAGEVPRLQVERLRPAQTAE